MYTRMHTHAKIRCKGNTFLLFIQISTLENAQKRPYCAHIVGFEHIFNHCFLPTCRLSFFSYLWLRRKY